jgi:catalase
MNMFWDFLSQTPESIHQVSILFSDRGTPDGFRHVNGYSSHTFKWVNKAGDAFWTKLHFKTDAGIKNLSAAEAEKVLQ